MKLFRKSFNEEEQSWISMIHDKRPTAIAILNPQWLGVKSSTEQHFKCLLYLKDNIEHMRAKRVAEMIEESGCHRVVISGFPISYRYIVEAIYNQSSNVRIYVIWHGSFLQSDEDYNWQAFKLVYELCKEGLIQKWGFVKKGMAEVVAQTGISTCYIMNYVNHIPEGPSSPVSRGLNFGMWSIAPIWRKIPYAMLAAISHIPNAKVFMLGQSERAQEFADLFQVRVKFRHNLMPHSELIAALSQMDLNLYVTLSECAPMLPLESLSVGVPCLIGPTSHLFEDHSYLHSRLVVPYPDRSDIIVKYINRALEERSEIINEYIRYAPEYNRNARKTLYDFLEIPDNCNSAP